MNVKVYVLLFVNTLFLGTCQLCKKEIDVSTDQQDLAVYGKFCQTRFTAPQGMLARVRPTGNVEGQLFVAFNGPDCHAKDYAWLVKADWTITSTQPYLSVFSSYPDKSNTEELSTIRFDKGERAGNFEKRACGGTETGQTGKITATPKNVRLKIFSTCLEYSSRN